MVTAANTATPGTPATPGAPAAPATPAIIASGRAAAAAAAAMDDDALGEDVAQVSREALPPAGAGEPSGGDDARSLPALVALSGRLGLTPFEQNILLLCVATEIDTSIDFFCLACGSLAAQPIRVARASRALALPEVQRHRGRSPSK